MFHLCSLWSLLLLLPFQPHWSRDWPDRTSVYACANSLAPSFHLLCVLTLVLKQQQAHIMDQERRFSTLLRCGVTSVAFFDPLIFPPVILSKFTNSIQGPYPKVPRVRFLLQAPPDPKHSNPTQFLSIYFSLSFLLPTIKSVSLSTDLLRLLKMSFRNLFSFSQHFTPHSSWWGSMVSLLTP